MIGRLPAISKPAASAALTVLAVATGRDPQTLLASAGADVVLTSLSDTEAVLTAPSKCRDVRVDGVMD
jgi:hypothetical protein